MKHRNLSKTFLLMALGVYVPTVMAAPTTAPAPDELIANLTVDQNNLSAMLGQNNSRLKDPAARNEIAPKAIALMHQMVADSVKLTEAAPEYRSKTQSLKQQFLPREAALGDKTAVAEIHKMVASKDSAVAVRGKSYELIARWYTCENTVAGQSAVFDDLEKLDRENTANIPLTMLTVQFARQAVTPELQDRMLAVVTDVMKNEAAVSVKEQLEAMKTAAAAAHQLENKPLTIAGATPEGKAFTSADLKGKVVLVDFWATWCGPCKEELPRVKKMYGNYHKKGLEVIGVSNDFNVDALTAFTAKEQMPWPELFDADAAAAQQWNPVTVAQGITGIPTMYLIDKKGILRSVTARDNLEELIPKLLAETN